MLARQDESDERRRELVFVSDFQRSNWSRANFSVLPADTKIQLESVAAETQIDNLAIVGGGFMGRASAGSPVKLEIDVLNASPAPRAAAIEINVGSASLQFTETFAANRTTHISRSISLPAPGWQIGEARLLEQHDALSADDKWPLTVCVHEQPNYAIITDQPSNLRPSSSHYLECALAPGGRSEREATPIRRVDPDDLSSEILAEADLLVIDHPSQLDTAACDLLAAMLRQGKPLLYVTAESIDATNLRQLADRLGSSWQLPVEFLPPPAARPRRELEVVDAESTRAPFNVFGDNVRAAIGSWRIQGGLMSRSVPNALRDDVLATMQDGSAFLIVSSVDAGVMAILNADLNRSNVAVSESFVPLLHELVSDLTSRRTALTATTGEPFVGRLPLLAMPASQLTVVGSTDRTAEMSASLGELRDESSGIVWQWSSPTRPGVYQVRNSAEQNGETLFALPVACDAAESDLRPLSPDVIQRRLASGRSLHFRAASDPQQERDSWWSWFASLAAICLLGEVATLCLFRS